MELLSLGALSNVVQIGGLAATARGNTVEQKFQRNLAEVDFRLERQKLHREDVRDLMELTVGRMDLYHVVGTLLLTFCISWYTGNGVVAAGLPRWFATLFLINNFCAVGYLIFSVWLAMHASIVAHSISVRLLTSFARLSIPGPEQLDALRTPFYGEDAVRDFQSAAGALLGSGGGGHARALARASSGLGAEPARLGGRQTSNASVTSRALSRSRLASSPSCDATQDAVDCADARSLEPDREHFQRFLGEQSRWLSYDAYSRICMALGMNQMLQALAYYTQGVLWTSSPVAACTTFFAIKFLGLLLMKLDVGFGHNGWADAAAVVFFYIGPPLVASSMLSTFVARPELVHSGGASLVATSCFLLHAAWLAYILGELRSGDGELPPRFRAVYYLNVVELQQRKIAAAVRADAVQGRVEKVRTARIELRCNMEEVMSEEATHGEINAEERHGESLVRLANQLERRLGNLRSSEVGGSMEALIEVDLAEQALHHFEVWVQAPAVLEKLEALRAAADEGWLSDEEKAAVEGSYQAFLRQCKELDVGVLRVPRGAAGAGARPGTGAKLRVVVLGARNLRDTGSGILGDISDPYVVASLGSQLHRTPVVKNDLDPVWNWDNSFTFELTEGHTSVDLEVFNRNVLRDDSLGSCSVDALELKPAGGGAVRLWRALRHGGGAELQLELQLEAAEGAEEAGATPVCVRSGEGMQVRVDAYYEDLGLPENVWVSAGPDGEVRHSGPPNLDRVTSFEGAMRETGQWSSAAGALLPPPGGLRGGAAASAARAPAPARRVSFAPSAGGRAGSDGEESPAAEGGPPAGRGGPAAAALLPASATPPEALPGRLFRALTVGIAAWWVLAAVVHVAGVLHDTHLLHDSLKNWTFPEHAQGDATELKPEEAAGERSVGWWPEPAAFFQVASLQCTGSRLWVGSRHSPGILAADRRPAQRLGPLRELGADEHGVPLECRGCAAGASSGPASSWLLPLDGVRAAGKPVPLLADWLIVAGYAPPPPREAGAPPPEARLAGWDGSSVVLAGLHWDGGAGNWSLRPRLEVEPSGVANCTGWGGGRCFGPRPSTYEDVIALQLAEEGNVLLVLLPGGLLDAWDTATGAALGRWSYPHPYSAMCYDGSGLVLARQGGGSPALEYRRPPWGALAPRGEDGAGGRPGRRRLRRGADGERPLAAG